MIINSRKNSRIKFYASLKQKKYRKEYGLYLVEGVKMVREAFKYNQKVVALIGLSENLSEYRDYDVEILEVTSEVLEVVTDAQTPQGIIAVVKIPSFEIRPLKGVSVCLDGVSDCGNLGAIFRILTALEIKNVYLINCADSYSPKTVRSSMSGLFCVNTYEVTAEQFGGLLGDIPLISADMNGENVFDFTPPKEFCVLFGSEGHGASEEVSSLSKLTVKIPMKNQLESLNVSVSAGIILYQLLKTTLF